MNTVADSARSPAWRDWRYYSKWWCLWTVGLFELEAIGSIGDRAHSALGVVLGIAFVAVGGAALALIPASIFTLMQNGMNQQRRRWLAWAFAIATYMGCALVFALVMLPLRR